MKKFMIMAAAALMMSGNAMAVENNSQAPETIEAKSMNKGNEEAVRVMIHKNGEVTNRFDYTIDNDGRVTSKTMYRFNRTTSQWVPVMQYTAVYGEESNTLTFAAYNKKEACFNNQVVTTSYCAEDCPVLIALPECINY